MNRPTTLDLILIRAAGDGELTWEATGDKSPAPTHRFVWDGRPADADAETRLFPLIRDGFLRIADDNAQRSAVTPTDDGWALLS